MRARDEADLRAGLACNPKRLNPKWFYDERGSELFVEITRLDEYYPTACEAQIIQENGLRIAQLSGCSHLVEIGSGTSEKTRQLIEAFQKTANLNTFLPFDVSPEALDQAKTVLEGLFDGLSVTPVVGDFHHQLNLIPFDDYEGSAMAAFLGGTVGNFFPAQRMGFYHNLANAMRPGDALLLGTDLIKPTEVIELAYNDPTGVTAAFNLNMLRVLNREFEANFVIEEFEHRAWFDPDNSWIEMQLISKRDQTVNLGRLGICVEIAAGEHLQTEISTKFSPGQVAAELDEAGFELIETFTDPREYFGLCLARRT